MLIERIKRHNIINGFLFSTLEFGGVAVLLCAFAGAVLTLRFYVLATICVGIALNCLPAVYYGIQSLRRHEKDFGIAALFRRETRELIQKRYPQTGVDTLIISATVLIPFAAMVLALIDAGTRRKA